MAKFTNGKKANPSQDTGLMEKLYNRLINSQPGQKWLGGYVDPIADAYKNAGGSPLFEKQIVSNTGIVDSAGEELAHEFTPAGNMTKMLGANIAAHPYKSAGIGLLGAGNVAGLFDNDQIAGQLVGLGAGGLASKFLLPKMKAGGIANSALTTLGGGFLGGLFDVLMAKKKEEEAIQQAQYAQNGIY